MFYVPFFEQFAILKAFFNNILNIVKPYYGILKERNY